MSAVHAPKASGFVKKVDAPIEVLLFDRLTIPLVGPTARVIPALLVTAGALVVRVLAAVAFAAGSMRLGAGLAFGGFVLDALDGKVARLQVRHQHLHGLLDFLLDQIGFGAMAIGLMHFARSNHHLELGVLTFVLVYMVLLAAGGSRFRLLGEVGLDWKEPGATQRFLSTAPETASPVRRFYQAVARFEGRLRRHRVLARPTSIEGLFVFLVLAPALSLPLWSIGLATLLLIPDTAVMFLSTILLAASRDRDGSA